MTLDRKHPHPNKDAPFTGEEAAAAYLVSLVLPWVVLAPGLLLGASLRTFPALPRPWFGFWVAQLTSNLANLLALTLLIDHPRILRERMSKFWPDKDTSNELERKYVRNFTITGIFSHLFVAWDASGQAQGYPHLWNFIGSILYLGSVVAATVVCRANPYASRIVYKQHGQQLITSGPYRIVRHPMYLAMIFYSIGFPLCVGSFRGILPMAVPMVLVARRTFHEEEFLEQSFPDEYKAYRQDVKYRMIPFVF